LTDLTRFADPDLEDGTIDEIGIPGKVFPL
jgi:hypothetical protein